MHTDRPETRLLKTKMFVEQLVIKRKLDGPPGAWEAPRSQTEPIDEQINKWIDKTGNELVSVTTPGIFMQWMDAERSLRLVITTVMVVYIPAVAYPVPLIKEPNNASRSSLSCTSAGAQVGNST